MRLRLLRAIKANTAVCNAAVMQNLHKGVLRDEALYAAKLAEQRRAADPSAR